MGHPGRILAAAAQELDGPGRDLKAGPGSAIVPRPYAGVLRLPSAASPATSPSTKTCRPLVTYWLTVSASPRQQVTRHQVVSSQFLPL